MIVEDAERFGLAQLHQFRGRVGRGQAKSYCVLVSAADTETALERLHVLESTNDGFALAEKDLQLRGPGDFLGTRQSGLPQLRIAQFTDLETLARAREAALRIFELDPNLENAPTLAQQVQRFWRGEGDIN
jgi:ATP-dependent DNA helicase RecG